MKNNGRQDIIDECNAIETKRYDCKQNEKNTHEKTIWCKIRQDIARGYYIRNGANNNRIMRCAIQCLGHTKNAKKSLTIKARVGLCVVI